MNAEVDRVQAAIEALTMRGADPQRIAEVAASAWRGIALSLSPVIGLSGVAALYTRSLELVSAAYPGLATVDRSADPDNDFDALRTALMQQTSGIASAASGALLSTFCDLLTQLIGAALSERLLRPVWDPSSYGLPARDLSP